MRFRVFITVCLYIFICAFSLGLVSDSSFAARKLNFNDVNANQWFFTNVSELNNLGRLRFFKQSFRPYDNIDLSEFLPILMSDKHLFNTSDKYIDTAIKTNLISNSTDTHEPLTKLKMAELLCKYYNLSSDTIYLADTDSPSANALIKFGIINPYPVNNELYFTPDRKVLKCEAAYLVSRFIKLRRNHNTPLPHATPAKTILPIAMYHEITTDTSKLGQLFVSPEKFESDIITLIANGYTPITPSELDASMQGLKPLPKKPVMITFDDGYKGNYTYAFSIALEYNFKFSVSIVGNNISRDATFFDAYSQNLHLTESEIYEMHASGLVDFLNHTYDLHKSYADFHGQGVNMFKYESKKKYLSRLGYDFTSCNNLINFLTGKAPVALVYPMGINNSFAEIAAKNVGFPITLLATDGINDLNNGTTLLKRTNVDQNLDSATLLLTFEDMLSSQ